MTTENADKIVLINRRIPDLTFRLPDTYCRGVAISLQNHGKAWIVRDEKQRDHDCRRCAWLLRMAE